MVLANICIKNETTEDDSLPISDDILINYFRIYKICFWNFLDCLETNTRTIKKKLFKFQVV